MSSAKDNAYTDAPEVVASHKSTGADGLQAVGSPESEGPQVVDARPYYATPPAYSSRHGNPFEGDKEYSTQSAPRSGGNNRRKWILGASIAIVLVIIAVAVGVGVGVTQSSKSSSSSSAGDSQSAQSTSARPTTSTTPSRTSSAVSSTSSAVTSGPTGLAQFSCEAGGVMTSADDVKYTQACFQQYANGGANYYHSNETIENVEDTLQLYTFQSCINACDKYNKGRSTGDLPCEAVTYYANITQAFENWAASCFLKSGRAVAFTGDDTVDYTHTASAYWSCLDDNTCTQ